MNICEFVFLFFFHRPNLRVVLEDGIYHNEDLYDEPNTFRPERYLSSEFGAKPGADITGLRPDLHFGSGRVRLKQYSALNDRTDIRLSVYVRECT